MTADVVTTDGAPITEAAASTKEELLKTVEKLEASVEEKPEVELKSMAVEYEKWKKSKEDEEEKEKDDTSPVSAAAVMKSSSFKEESNFLADLKEYEKKALIEMRSLLEEAIIDNKLFEKAVQEDKEGGTKEEAKEPNAEQDGEGEHGKPDAAEVPTGEVATEEPVNKEVSIWGVPLLPSKCSEVTDVVLLKFLRAREFRVKEAFEMLKNNLRWRKESKIDTILDEEMLDEDLRSTCYMDGADRQGHPVCYNVSGLFQDGKLYKKAFGTAESRKKFLRWRIHQMEQGIRKLDLKPGGVASLLQITDLKNSPGLLKKELKTTMKEAVQLLQDNYPEFVARNIFINVPFWYYAFHAVLSPFLTQRTKSKMVFVRPAKVTETLLKYIPAEAIPVQYGGLKRKDDDEFSVEDGGVSEITVVKAGSTEAMEIPIPETGSTLVWDLTVLGWEVNYREEFVPSDEGSYTIIVQKGKKMGSQEEPVRNSFRNNEPGKIVLTIENNTFKKKKVLYRYKTQCC